MPHRPKPLFAKCFVIFYATCLAPFAHGYTFDQVVPDVRQPASLSGGSAYLNRRNIAAERASRPASVVMHWDAFMVYSAKSRESERTRPKERG